jgi:hypothetical protein
VRGPGRPSCRLNGILPPEKLCWIEVERRSIKVVNEREACPVAVMLIRMASGNAPAGVPTLADEIEAAGRVG